MKYCLEMPHYLDEHFKGVTKVLPELSKTQTSKVKPYAYCHTHTKNMSNYL